MSEKEIKARVDDAIKAMERAHAALERQQPRAYTKAEIDPFVLALRRLFDTSAQAIRAQNDLREFYKKRCRALERELAEARAGAKPGDQPPAERPAVSKRFDSIRAEMGT